MCIRDSSYLQHLTNKQKETEKAPLEVRHKEGGSFFFLSASGFLCLRHTKATSAREQPRLHVCVGVCVGGPTV